MDSFVHEKIVLQNERVRLEPLTQDHFEPLWLVASQRSLWAFTSVDVKTKEEFGIYFQQALKDKADLNSYPFAIFDKRENRYAGSTRFLNIVPAHKRLEIGWTWYDESLQRTGLNRNSKLLLLTYCFEILEFNRVELKTSSTNHKSRNAMEQIGAVKEGILRHHMINPDGSLRDSVYYSFVLPEWPAIKARIFSGYDELWK